MGFHYKIYGIGETDTKTQTLCSQNNLKLSLLVGNSKNNSKSIVNIEVKRTIDKNNNYQFNLYINGCHYKNIVFNPKTKEFDKD